VNLIFLEPEPSDKEQEASEEIENEKEDSHEKEDSETVDNNEKEYESDDSVSWDTGYRKKSLGKLSVFYCFSWIRGKINSRSIEKAYIPLNKL